MSDNSATATYRGTGITCGGWGAIQGEAEESNANPEVLDLTADQDGQVVLEGDSGETGGFGSKPGDRVANLNITHVSKPAVTRGIPANTATNPLGRGK